MEEIVEVESEEMDCTLTESCSFEIPIEEEDESQILVPLSIVLIPTAFVKDQLEHGLLGTDMFQLIPVRFKIF